MKKVLIALVFALLVPLSALADADQVTWDAVTTHEDGTGYTLEEQGKMVYHVFVEDAEFASVTGVALWEGTLPQSPGEAKSYHVVAEYNGLMSKPSAKTLFVYPKPESPPSAPGTVIIHLKK